MLHYIIRNVPRPILIKGSLFLQKYFEVFYRGYNFYDPINQKNYRTFLPYGRHKSSQRNHALSPGTLSLERHRLMWLLLQRKTDFFNNNQKRKVLHIAPEQCFYKKFREMKNIDYATADLESPIADYKFDIHDIPFKDACFDIIFCNHVLEHVENDIQCMKELFRVLKPGGWAILQVPIDNDRVETLEDENINTPQLREKYYWQKDHMRLYGTGYPKILESVGFITQNINRNELVSEDEEVKCMLGDEPLYIFHKPM